MAFFKGLKREAFYRNEAQTPESLLPIPVDPISPDIVAKSFKIISDNELADFVKANIDEESKSIEGRTRRSIEKQEERLSFN